MMINNNNSGSSNKHKYQKGEESTRTLQLQSTCNKSPNDMKLSVLKQMEMDLIPVH